ncbi:tyrosine--tRNA ligase [uncultured Nisaea sp.]|uniref:tyrosine--tRNA ligase n=1 Tax=uncultured Nisaea sp. TaxID=538215 RepID=UPI0030EF82DE|tara:strand:+ start:5342 stop:6589 length:1248 start_codon:yes stop_codon:yes gene_type:complete
MSQFKSGFMQTMSERGFVHQCTDNDALDEMLNNKVVTAYIGFDCTADSLHVGSLIQIMMLRHLQRAGHRPIVLMGGGTSKIGDPSFKDEARKLLSDEDIEHNKSGIKTVFQRFLSFGEESSDAIMCDNAEWLDGLEYIPFLRKIGQHFSVNRMLSFDSVKTRLEREQSLSFLEFNYMILQAYDFLELRRRYGCQLQMGGSDQWGNIVNGVELTRRVDQQSVFGLTTPLLTTASGLKMGKTEKGAIWLNKERLSPYDYWQFWRNTEDADVGKFLRLFTELPLDEIARLEKLEGAELNDAKKVLANEATALLHGREEADTAAESARKTFEQGALGDSLPRVSVEASQLSEGLWIVDAMRIAGLAATNGEARRLIKNGGARVNDVAVSDEALKLGDTDLADGVIKLSSGKKKHVLLEI